MYINICKDIIINSDDIIGIFNIEGKIIKNSDIINRLCEKKYITDFSNNNAKSLIIYIKNNEQKGILSNISSISLGKKKKIIN